MALALKRVATHHVALALAFRYKEVQEQRFWQERLGTRDVDELGIDTNASFLADAVQPLPPGLAAPAPAPQPKAAAAPQHVPKAAPPAAGRAGAKEKEGGIPIIIVPSGCVPDLACANRASAHAACGRDFLAVIFADVRHCSQCGTGWARRCCLTCSTPSRSSRTAHSFHGSSRNRCVPSVPPRAPCHVAHGNLRAAGGRAQGGDA